ncbi:MAG TPA: urate hydroxylase PuuD [Terriglobales bacterium]
MSLTALSLLATSASTAVHGFLAAVFSGPGVHLPQDASTNVQMFWRWLHITAAILWIGLLYYFNLVNTPFLRELDPAVRSRIFAPLMLRAMNWFRWSSLVTVLAGIAYWGEIVHADAKNAGAKQGGLLGSWFLIWIAAWIVFYLCLRFIKNGWAVGTLGTIAVIIACIVFLKLNSQGWESNRTLSIGLGGGIGFFLMLNVWGIIWRVNKRLIRWTEDFVKNNTPIPAQAAEFARQSIITSRCGFVLTLPVIFFMAAASHYPMFGA